MPQDRPRLPSFSLDKNTAKAIAQAQAERCDTYVLEIVFERRDASGVIGHDIAYSCHAAEDLLMVLSHVPGWAEEHAGRIGILPHSVALLRVAHADGTAEPIADPGDHEGRIALVRERVARAATESAEDNAGAA